MIFSGSNFGPTQNRRSTLLSWQCVDLGHEHTAVHQHQRSVACINMCQCTRQYTHIYPYPSQNRRSTLLSWRRVDLGQRQTAVYQHQRSVACIDMRPYTRQSYPYPRACLLVPVCKLLPRTRWQETPNKLWAKASAVLGRRRFIVGSIMGARWGCL